MLNAYHYLYHVSMDDKDTSSLPAILFQFLLPILVIIEYSDYCKNKLLKDHKNITNWYMITAPWILRQFTRNVSFISTKDIPKI